MDKQQAKYIIEETFEKPFDKNRFIHFIKNLLSRVEEAPFAYHGQFIPEAYRQYISILERIGKFNDGENRIDILIIKLQRETSLERARTNQRNFVAGYLQGKYGSSNEKEAALVAFVSPDNTDWRFSLVKMDYKFEQTPTGKMKVKEEFTPARRWSFLVGANERSHTAQSRLVNILANDEQVPTLAELEKAFDIETVTKEFFLKYRDLFIRTKEALDKVVKNDVRIKADFEAKGVNTVDFAKKLLGQIVFLYFLQKKGWFGVGRDAAWGTGAKQFLRELFEGKHGSYSNFFDDILEPLFYEALRIGEERKQDDYYYSRFNCKIPFLNGGLFDPIGNYDWVHTDIQLPDSLFSNKNTTKEGDTGDGILDIFDRYNFTVKEDEPLEKEVAIDPELLGKAYEKFNAIRPDNFEEYKKALKSGKKGDETKFNKQFGVYYTPREIVHYMCQQSLINYLFTELNSGKISYEKLDDPHLDMFGNKGKKGQLDITVEHTENPEILKEDIETLIHLGEQVSENEARVISEGKETKTYSYQLSKSIRNNAELFDRKLEDITVCDPAVGSGAFPVGMLSEIVKARTVLSTFIENKANRSPYYFKRRCIEHSLYGVDIDPGAVEIAKLRLWLSLVVDEDDIKNIKPLPNLDYKIVCGNSLLGYPYTPMGLEKIEKLKEMFIKEVNPTRKNELRSQIDDAIYGLFKNTEQSLNYKVTMDFKINFSEVFHKKGGFDVVIANPPYVRADNSEFKELRKATMASKFYETLYERWDLFVPFIESGLKLLNNNGFICYITSNSLLTSKFAFKILEYIQSNFFTQFIDYFDDAWVFDAGVIPVVFGISRSTTKAQVVKTIHADSFKNISHQVKVPMTEFKKLGKDAFKQVSHQFDLKVKTLPIGNICYISYGLRPNSDERYWQGEFTRDDLVSETKDKIHCMPNVEGKNLASYRIDKILYLEWGTKRVPQKLVRPTFPELYNRPKLLCGTMTGGTYDNSGVICNHSIVVFVPFYDLHGVENRSISGSIKKFNDITRRELEKISKGFGLKYLIAVINSRFAYYFLNSIRRHRLENYFYPDDYRNLPVADIDSIKQKPFIETVDKILSLTQSDDYPQNQAKQAKVKKFEKEIDRMVYDLYGLTEEEIKIVEGF